jgi:hypothetical protein
MLECELGSMKTLLSVEIAKELEYFVKLDNFDEEKQILGWHEMVPAYLS